MVDEHWKKINTKRYLAPSPLQHGPCYMHIQQYSCGSKMPVLKSLTAASTMWTKTINE